MNFSALITALSRPTAFPVPVADVQVIQTHLSVVFLAGDFVYKIKKPVDLGFADFTTLERRRHFCDEEVRLNRRLAPQVYLGVVPVTQDLRFEGVGTPIEWAVKMHRLPTAATLEQRLAAGTIHATQIRALAERVALFHRATAPLAPTDWFAIIAHHVRDNFAQSQPLVGLTVLPAVFERLRRHSEAALTQLEPLLRQRSSLVRDTHGDLRLEHVYLFPDRAPPDDLVVIDCIEFNEQFRFADPGADVAFLVMDLLGHGRADLAQLLSTTYGAASGDMAVGDLLRFYAAYRAVVRGKVEGIAFMEAEVPDSAKPGLREQARSHFLLALSLLEPLDEMPCLVLVGGLPGSGKSTVAAQLAARDGYAVLRSDVIRKQMIGDPQQRYSNEATEHTYAECLRRAQALVHEGRRVLVDATFRQEAHRRLFLEAAQHWGVPGMLLLCTASPAVVEHRLATRRNDVSDADWKVHQQLANLWEPTHGVVCLLNTDGTPEEVAAHARAEIATEWARQRLRGSICSA